MDGAAPDRWSAVAAAWSQLWGGFAEPAWRVVAEATRIGPGVRVLDVGCGSGEFLAHLDELDAVPAGVDPAPGMVQLARRRVPGADVRSGASEDLPWPDAQFDVGTSFNALQFADDPLEALAELVRVVTPGGRVAVANWAEAEHNALSGIEDAVARADGEEPLPDGPTRRPGGIERLLERAGLEVTSGGLVSVPWHAPDDDTLVRGILLGEDQAVVAATAPTVLGAAQRFRTTDGGYRLLNAFRWAAARVPA